MVELCLNVLVNIEPRFLARARGFPNGCKPRRRTCCALIHAISYTIHCQSRVLRSRGLHTGILATQASVSKK